MALGIHMMITAVFLAVFGEGLAIRGDAGAMVRAINGFIDEQHTIVSIFSTAIFFFATFQMVGMLFVMMDVPTASACSALVLVMLIYTYVSALRIYNRFYWDKTKTAWDDMEEDVEAELYDLNPQFQVDDKHSKEHHRSHRKGRKSVKFADSLDGSSHLRTSLLAESESPPREAAKEKQRHSLLRTMGLARPRAQLSSSAGSGSVQQSNPTAGSESTYGRPVYNPANDYSTPYFDQSSILSSSAGDYTEIGRVANASEMVHSTVAGYMTLKTRKKFSMDPWERRYFVIRGTLIYFYRNQAAFHAAPAEPINHRPIDLEGYGLIAGAEEPPYVISLVPVDSNDNRKAWKFRCDTITEFHNWISMFAAALRLTESGRNIRLLQISEQTARSLT